MAHTFAMEYCSIFIESGQGFFMHKDNKENATDPTSKPKIFSSSLGFKQETKFSIKRASLGPVAVAWVG